jgi:hypothetical protein
VHLPAWASGNVFALAHIKPVHSGFEVLGRTPKYKLGLYGPQSKLWLLRRPISLVKMDSFSAAANPVSLAKMVSAMANNW